MSDVKPIPEGYPVVSPGLAIDGAAAAIDFYQNVFGATERMRMPGPGGKIAHCELMFGNSVVMLGDPAPDMDFLDPKTVGGTPVNLYVYVEDADAAFAAALAAGATELTPMTTQFYGDRSGAFEDPWGHRWTVATHVEDVPPEEMDRRMAEQFGGS
ncbi:VOC family protein [Nocardia sp. NBC_00508]|uniref:VOC family protein n=1 Tax=Nocardia sp. NBC_00508 TaxID=2975992 RepID=UPI002E7FCCE3|nr:VOC family protein [Nocardia sp. NBC_00508]WUD67571.1 VOC family protein [Nocardia sp. NBC_00508]